MANSDLEKTLKEIATQMVVGAVKTAMETHVAPKVKEKLREHIQSDVLDKDFKGKRNNSSGNLINPKNTVIDFYEDGLSFRVYNVAEPKSIFKTPLKTIAADFTPPESVFGYWIEAGKVPLLWDNGETNYILRDFTFTDKNGNVRTVHKFFPKRPFVEKTRKELKKNDMKILKDAMKNGLKAQGIKIK